MRGARCLSCAQDDNSAGVALQDDAEGEKNDRSGFAKHHEASGLFTCGTGRDEWRGSGAGVAGAS
jgi:hypothetical protein